MSGIINKVKDALHKDKHEETAEGVHGPHGSRAANAADPRVDSDRDHRGNTSFGNTTGTHTGTHTGTGAYAHEGAGYGTTGTSEGLHGPHGSRVANAADPRVDSDRDHRGAPGSTTGIGHNTHSTGTHGVTGTTGGYSSGTTEGLHGPHGSRVANAADPRVDSDRDHRGAPGTTGFGSSTTHGTHTGTGAYGHEGAGYGTTGTSEGLHGPHSSRVANAADPRVDSDRDHRGSHATTHVGPADNTAGPHKSDALNKIDPRVDSDLDGSKTLGGNKTHAY